MRPTPTLTRAGELPAPAAGLEVHFFFSFFLLFLSLNFNLQGFDFGGSIVFFICFCSSSFFFPAPFFFSFFETFVSSALNSSRLFQAIACLSRVHRMEWVMRESSSHRTNLTTLVSGTGNAAGGGGWGATNNNNNQANAWGGGGGGMNTGGGWGTTNNTQNTGEQGLVSNFFII